MTRRLTEVQSRIERDEFERGHLPNGAEPAQPKPAATTVVARPGAEAPFELLLLKRPMASRFAAGAYVFPGGVVDPSDGDAYWTDVLPDLPNLPPDGPAAATAALRELFEETGILLLDEDCTVPGLDDARAALLRDELPFEEIVRACSGSFADAPMTYFARWITPRRLARRYDALFFLVALTDRTHRVSITDEHDEVVWISAADALASFEAGDLPMLFPTWNTIARLSEFDDLDRAAAVLSGRDVDPIEPVLDVDGGSVRPRMPDAPGT